VSFKEECPGCGGWTSAIGEAFGQDNPCPACGLPAATAVEVLAVRQSRANAQVRAQAEAAVLDAGRWQARARSAEFRLRAIGEALDADPPEWWQPDQHKGGGTT
jgi:hypothetical protein